MTRVLRLSRLSPLLLLAAALAALAVFFVNHAPPAAADHSRDTEPWTATLTVVRSGSTERGFSSGTFGSLSDTTFTHAGVDFEVRELTLRDGNGALIFGFNRSPNSLKSPALTLHVGNRQFALADATVSSTRLRWENTGLSWAEGQGVPVKLVYSPWTGVDLYGGDMVHDADGYQYMDLNEGSNGTFRVRLDQAPTADVTITIRKLSTFEIDDFDAATVSPQTLTFTPTNWSTGQRVTVSAATDGDDDDDRIIISARVSIASDADANDPYRNPARRNGFVLTVTDTTVGGG